MLRVLLIVGAVFAIFWFVVVPVFERFAPASIVRAYQRLTMPFFRVMAGYAPGFGVIETTGRRTGRPRQVPVGGRVSGDTFWFVAGIGRRARYMKNIEANPRVRVKVNGRWRSGTAYFCPEDDARRRRFTVSPMNGLFLWVAGGEALSVRVEFDR